MKSSKIPFFLMTLFFAYFALPVRLHSCSPQVKMIGPPPEPPNCCEGLCTASPCYVKTGNYAMNQVDLQMGTRGSPLSVGRRYSSQRPLDGSLGLGATSNLGIRLTYATSKTQAPASNEAVVVMPDKTLRFLENTDGTFSAPVESHDSLVRNPDGTFTLTPALLLSRYLFSATGSLVSFTDDYGNTLSYSYDGNGRLQQISDAGGSGRYLNIYYGADGRVSAIQDSAGRTVQYSYNVDGSLSSVMDPGGRTTSYSYVTGRFGPLLSQVRDHWSRVITNIAYDISDRVSSYTQAGEIYSFTYNYQGDSTRTSKTDLAGKVWVYTFNNQGLITERVPPSGNGGGTATTVFNADGSIQLQTDEMGVLTAYTYNADGSVSSITRDYGGTSSVRFDYSYDENFPGKVISITPKNPSSGAIDRDWQEWKYDYYQAGNPAPGSLFHVYRVRSDGTVDTLATYTYNSAGQVLTVTDAASSATSYNYDPVTGDLASVSYPKNSDSGPNPVYQYGRDAAGRVISVTDPLGKITTYSYDSLDRITSVTLPKPSPGSPLNFVATYTYDNYDAATGLVFTNQTDANSKMTKQGYDQFGQLIKSIDALNNTTTFTYTKGLLTSISDANGNVTGYAYNGLNRLITTTFPDSATESYTYYADGLLKTKRDRKNQTITYTYDPLKRLTQKSYPNGATILYSYTGQKLMTVTDNLAGETHTLGYDSSYRISSNTQGSRGTLNYTYDAADRAATYSVASGPSATYVYYSDGSLKSIDWTPISGQFLYSYTLNGQYGSITFPNGQQRNYTYDDQGRLLQLANTIGSTDLGTFAYGYDNPLLGQRTSMTSALGATNYSYDSNYQLTGATYPNAAPFNGEVHSWTYDNIGNRLTNTVNASTANYTYYKNGTNPLNGQRLQSDGTKTYTYDANGNVIGDGTYTNSWDYENRLTGITGGALTASYTYDYLGRRKSKTVNGVTTTYLYDGQNLIRETTATTADYVFGSGIDEPLAQSGGGAISYYAVDGLGSATVLDDPIGAVQNSYTYDAWGVIRNQTGSTPNRFTYTSRESSEAGLLYYRRRFYNPNIGRFISEDALATSGPEASGEFDYYNYVLNNPIKSVDPYGLYSIDKSCNCTFVGPDGPGGPGFRMKQETDEWCKTKLVLITNPKRRKCLESRCQKGKIKCVTNCDPNTMGQAGGLFSKTAEVCLNNMPPGGWGDGQMGDLIIHEWAHTCKWDDCGEEGVPDNHRLAGHCIGRKHRKDIKD